MTAITMQGLVKRYGSTAAVDSVDLRVEDGQLYFLLGPSGCGKTTLLRMIAGFIEPTAGRIRFGDRDVTGLPANRRHVGMMFQSYALWPHMTVADNVAFGLRVRKVPRTERARRVAEALELVQMRGYEARKPGQLSGGQQQRVALARALVIRPEILLLDEPLSNLDAKLRLEMRSQIREVCKQTGITAVYVTHDQKEALSMADQIAVLRAGQVAQVGSPRELYQRPRTRFVCDFLGEANFLPATVVERREDRLIIDTPAGRLETAASADGVATGAALTCAIRPEALRIVEPAPTGAPADAAGPAEARNIIEGRVAQTIYLGEVAQYLVVLSSGTQVKVMNLHPTRPWEPNHPLRLAIDHADVVIVAE